MKMRSVMQHAFSQVPSADIPRSSFDRSHGYKTTFDAGKLIPFFIDEALPGDTFNLHMTGFARMATPIFPIMDNIFMETFFFAVPYRLLWDNWEKFNGAQDNPGDSTDFLLPTLTASPQGGFGQESIYDYLGLPTLFGGTGQLANINALPLRAYQLIWNEWFRDQNIQDSLVIPTNDGPDDWSNYTLLPRGKRHDYFTSCLPWPQKGDSVSLPLGQSAPVSGLGIAIGSAPNPGPITVATAEDPSRVFGPHWSAESGVFKIEELGGAGQPAIFADLTAAAAATINQLRQAFQIQKMYERDARSGTRYTEVVRAHFGVVSPDARLQRPEYLGGGSSMVNISPVAQTSGTAGVGGYTPTPQGTLSAFATAHLDNHGFTKSFTEHCVIIGLVNVRADLTYQQGVNRMWSRRTRFDFYWPALSHIGEQAVLNKEIFADGTATDDLVFGYQERYAEYRYKPSMVTGLFRSSHPQSLDAWHLSQEFTNVPTLSPAFIEDNPPLDRVIAVPSEPHFLFDSYINLTCARPMPVFGVPGLIDHF